jgi:hypothetical protein
VPDNKTKRGPPDRARIDPNDAGEVHHAAQRLGVTPAAVQAAIRHVGTSRVAVTKYLKAKK